MNHDLFMRKNVRSYLKIDINRNMCTTTSVAISISSHNNTARTVLNKLLESLNLLSKIFLLNFHETVTTCPSIGSFIQLSTQAPMAIIRHCFLQSFSIVQRVFYRRLEKLFIIRRYERKNEKHKELS